MNTENAGQHKHKRYDENFKRNTVELWLSGHKPAHQTAIELGITDQSLQRWKKELAVCGNRD